MKQKLAIKYVTVFMGRSTKVQYVTKKEAERSGLYPRRS